MTRPFAIALTTLLVSAPIASAQQLLIYPAGGQSAEQQTTDEAECRVWATRQTGFDPACMGRFVSSPKI